MKFIKDKLEEMENNLDKRKFITQEMRIKTYYKEVFNIEIKEVFYKAGLEKASDKSIKSKNYLSNLRILCFPIVIWIKDNNKKIFKHKFIKGNYNGALYRKENNKNLSFRQQIYCFVDTILCEYCQKEYLNKMNNETIEMIIKKNDQINVDYYNWIEQNYKEKQ